MLRIQGFTWHFWYLAQSWQLLQLLLCGKLWVTAIKTRTRIYQTILCCQIKVMAFIWNCQNGKFRFSIHFVFNIELTIRGIRIEIPEKGLYCNKKHAENADTSTCVTFDFWAWPYEKVNTRMLNTLTSTQQYFVA